MSYAFFGLREQPFGVAPDPRFTYFGQAHREAIASLYGSILEGRGCALLVAHPGMGKTTLLNYLRARLGHQADVAVLSNFASSRGSLLREIMSLLGCEATEGDGGENWRRLHGFLIERAHRNRKVVLICDDAQSLSHATLEDIALLGNLELPHQKLLQIVIAGQPGLLPVLRTPRLESLSQKIGIFSHVLPLPVEEVDAYVRHRLEVAGATREIFTAAARLGLAQSSKGIPLRINTISHAAMAEAWLANRDTVDVGDVERAAAGMLDSVFPWQVSEETAWSKLSFSDTAALLESTSADATSTTDIVRMRRVDRQVVMLKPTGDVQAVESVLAVHDEQSSSTRSFAKLDRMQRTGELFDAKPIAVADLMPRGTARGIAAWEPLDAGRDDGWRALTERVLAAPATGRCIALACLRGTDSAAVALFALGRALARGLERPVLLVEANGKPSLLERLLDLEPAPGLAESLATPQADAGDFVRPTGVEHLFALTAGRQPAMVAERLSTPDGEAALGRLRERYPVIVIELPSPGLRHHALEVFHHVDDVILVAKPGSSRVREAERALHRLSAARIPVLGTILDDVELWGGETLTFLQRTARLRDALSPWIEKLARRAPRALLRPRGAGTASVVDGTHA
jgi:type II secretory pathway predicted ATPase ExeA/Mrp family chromosome partitioning ATPase